MKKNKIEFLEIKNSKVKFNGGVKQYIRDSYRKNQEMENRFEEINQDIEQ